MDRKIHFKSRRTTFFLVLFYFVFILSCFTPIANAHFATVGYSDISIDQNTVNYVLDLDSREVGQWMDLNAGQKVFIIDSNASSKPESKSLDWEKPKMEQMITRFLSVSNNGIPGKAELTEFGVVKQGDVELLRFNVKFRFDQPIQQYVIRYNFFFDDIDPKHQNFAKLRFGELVKEQVFDQGHRSLSGSADKPQNTNKIEIPSWLETMRTYTWMGMKHIWEGYDHLLFLLGLVMLKQNKREYFNILTAFTVGHSITLALSALNIFTISLKIIEPLIALSIVYIAVENMRSKRPFLRWAIALIFGLVHGFGFADILRGAMSNDFVLSLLSFNLGVEIGQLAVWALLLPLLWLLGRMQWYPALTRSLSGAIGCLGLFWFIERVWQA